jgi:hypothetical protein
MDVSSLCGRGSVTTIIPEIRNLTPNSSLKLVEISEKFIKISYHGVYCLSGSIHQTPVFQV